jgi:hypothetical protein
MSVNDVKEKRPHILYLYPASGGKPDMFEFKTSIANFDKGILTILKDNPWNGNLKFSVDGKIIAVNMTEYRYATAQTGDDWV